MTKIWGSYKVFKSVIWVYIARWLKYPKRGCSPPLNAWYRGNETIIKVGKKKIFILKKYFLHDRKNLQKDFNMSVSLSRKRIICGFMVNFQAFEKIIYWWKHLLSGGIMQRTGKTARTNFFLVRRCKQSKLQICSR